MREQPAAPRPRTICMLSPLAGGFYYGDMMAGAAAAAWRYGVQVIGVQTSLPWPEDAGQPRPAPYVPLAWEHADGFIIVVDALSPQDLRRVAASGKPIVTVSMPNADPAMPAVLPDNHGGAVDAVRHLIEHGHRRIGFAGCIRQEDIRQRYEGYGAALMAHGITPDPALCFFAPDNLESGGRTAAAALLAAGTPCTAIFVATDRNALALMDLVQAAGRRVPEDLAIVGFDDMDVAQQAVPALTSIHQRFDALGEAAAEYLLAAIDGQAFPAGPTVVPTALIQRHSCGCPGARQAPAVPVDFSAGQGWHDALASRLAQLLIAPLPLAAGTSSTQLWPGAGAVIEALEAAVLGRPAPPVAALDRAWQEAGARTRSAETFAAIVALLEHAGLARQHLDRPDELTMAPGLQTFLDGARVQILRTSMTDSLRQDRALRAAARISRAFLKRESHNATDLSWLAIAAARWACLGLWDGAAAGSERRLRIASCYDADRGALPGSAALVRPESFPTAEFLDAGAGLGAPPTVLLIPLGTPDRAWGILAVVGPDERQFHEAHDAIRHGATELTLALEYEDLFRSTERQRERLHASEERYRQVEENAPIGLALIAPDGRWLRVNRAVCEIVGYSKDELLALTFQDITHPDDLDADVAHVHRVLSGEIATYQMEKRYIHKRGHAVWIQLSVSLVRDSAGQPEYFISQIQDIAERKRLEQDMARMAQHDVLTGLPNRALFNHQLTRALAAAAPERPLALLLIDLDRFKEVNDTLGHQAGDDLLCEVAGRVRAALRPADSVARLGGDEFAVLLPETDEVGAVRVADRLRAALDVPLSVAGQTVAVDMSVGVGLAPIQTTDAATLLRFADIAMYEAKLEGGGCMVYRAERDGHSPSRLGLAAELRHAIGAGQLRLHFQPIVACATRRVDRMEALVRWQHPALGLLPPAQFVPLAETLSLITPLTMWVLEEALAQCRRWHDDGLPVGVAVNVAMLTMQDAQFPDLVAALLRRHELDPSYLTVEVTESMLMTRPAAAVGAVAALGALGVRVAMDDFGSGHSSLAHLQRLTVQEIKIDRSFVQQLASTRDSTLMAFMMGLAGALDCTVVAEGVETGEVWDWLVGLGCDAIQGYHFSRPMPSEIVVDWLRANHGSANDAGRRGGRATRRPARSRV